MKPTETASALQTCIESQQPACLWGSPGIGKSQIVHQLARSLNMLVRDVRAVLLDPVDLRGLPHVNGDNRAHWAIPEFLPRDGRGILFLDELNRAPQLVQNACFQLVLDRQLGEYILPPDWQVVAACNRESDGGGITKMSSALCNRFIHLDCEPDLDDWCKWAVKNSIEPAVIAFLRFRPDLLHKFDRTEKAFPSPRSWEFVSKIAGKQSNPNIEHALYAGTVGTGAAVEFSAFIRLYRSIPSIDAILLNPTSASVPTDPASLYAVAAALARRASVPNIRRAITYLDRMPQEYAVMAVKDATARDTGLCATSEFTSWCVSHSDVVF
jgi:dynein-related subfamily AAA family protein